MRIWSILCQQCFAAVLYVVEKLEPINDIAFDQVLICVKNGKVQSSQFLMFTVYTMDKSDIFYVLHGNKFFHVFTH